MRLNRADVRRSLGAGGVVLLLLWAAVDLAGGGPTQRPTAMDPALASDLEELATPVVEIWARQLHLAYATNEIAADAKYRGRRLLVHGAVQAISKDFLDRPYLALVSGNEFADVMATLDREAVARASQLQPGEVVTLRCTGAGRAVGSAILRACRFP
jgi:hypothetical protein